MLNLVLENKRDQYLLKVLEESTSELDTLKTKKYLTENLSIIRKVLVEEGIIKNSRRVLEESFTSHVSDNKGKYLAGAAAIGAGIGIHQNKDALMKTGGKALSDIKKHIPGTDDYNQHHITDQEGSQKYIDSLGLKTHEDYKKAISSGKISESNQTVQERMKNLKTSEEIEPTELPASATDTDPTTYIS